MKVDSPPANRPCWGTVVQRCGSNSKQYSIMHSLYFLQHVRPLSRDRRFQTLNFCLEENARRHSTIFIYPENKFQNVGRPIEVDSRWVRKVSPKYYFDPYLHAPNEVPLVSGSQFGVFSEFPFPDAVLVGIVGKSLLSGVVGGLSIGIVARGRGLVRKCGDAWSPWVLKQELIAEGSLAYSLQR